MRTVFPIIRLVSDIKSGRVTNPSREGSAVRTLARLPVTPVLLPIPTGQLQTTCSSDFRGSDVRC